MTRPTLVEFLTARLDEDEASARAASPSPWQYGDVDSVAGGSLYDATRMIGDLHYEQPDDHDGSIVRHLLSGEADANGAHIARHDPARVLADVKAKRAIVELRAALSQMDRADDRWEAGQIQSADFAVRHLATAYADHPDYRQEWKPWP
jgi:hypothetical protein